MVQYRGTLWYSGTILWYRWRLLAPLAEEGLEAGLGELDDLHVPGLGRLHAAHVLLLLAAEAGAVEEVAGGTPVQQGLHGKIMIICYKQTCKQCMTIRAGNFLDRSENEGIVEPFRAP